jgi:hypothetical protein
MSLDITARVHVDRDPAAVAASPSTRVGELTFVDR